jgi:hypothetical protein
MTETQTPEKRPPDHPAVPRPQQGKFLFAIVTAMCVAIVGGYGWFASTQRELGKEQRDQIPAAQRDASGMRSTPGGYRTYSYWHTGYHGGK